MTGARTLLIRYPAAVLLLLGMALWMRIWVPSGYMPVHMHGTVLMLPCSGQGVLGWPADGHDAADHDSGHDSHAGHDSDSNHAEQPCLFSALSLASLSGADPQLLLAALAFQFLAILRARVQPRPQRSAYLRPPAQAPPVIA